MSAVENGHRGPMYKSIYVALDNSEHSDAGTTVALELAEAFSARCIGMHVYAARMHDYRFKQMEYTLPDEYQDEAELLRQRRIHDSLITTGLQLISESYTDVMRYRCLEREHPLRSARPRRTQLGGAGRRHRRGSSRPCGHGCARHRRGEGLAPRQRRRSRRPPHPDRLAHRAPHRRCGHGRRHHRRDRRITTVVRWPPGRAQSR